MKQARNPDTMHPPLAGYVHQIEVGPGERILFMSGQLGMAPDGRLPKDPVKQLGLALDNVRRNLEAAGMAPEDLVKLTIYVAGKMDPDGRRAQLARALGTHQPTMTLLYVAALARPEFKVEIDAWAAG